MKTIKEHRAVSEGYAARSGDEKRFIDKHVVVKHADRNGNDDNVFKAKKMKTVRRMLDRHGYDAGKDHEVYEETDLNEAARERPAHFAFTHTPGDEESEKKLAKLKELVKKHNSNSSEESKVRIVARGRLGKNNPNAEKYHKKAVEAWKAVCDHAGSAKSVSEFSKRAKRIGNTHEKLLDHGGPHTPLPAIKESVEQIDELSKGTLRDYINRAADDATASSARAGSLHRARKDYKLGKRLSGINKAATKLAKEDVEQIDERERTQDELRTKWARYLQKSYNHTKKATLERKGAKITQDPRDFDVVYDHERLANRYKKAAAAAGRRLSEDNGLEETVVNEAKVVRYTRPDGTTALKSLNKHGKRKDWRDSEGGLKAALAHAGVDKIHEASGEEYRKNLLSYQSPARKKWVADQMKKKSTNEEVEQIDELSKDTLKSYINRAADDATASAARAGSLHRARKDYKLDKRLSGINKAVTKLANKKD